jgi:hypothetical protein
MPLFNRPSIPATKPMVPLSKLTTPNAAELAAKAKSPPAAQALLKPGMTSSEYVHTLQQNQRPLDAMHALAHGMPERHSVWWASQSSQKVAGKLNPEEHAATKAAEAWVKNPNETTRAAAAHAASKTDFKGPGGWAAQGAAWSKPAAPAPHAAAGTSAAHAAPGLTAPAVAGAVLLAAGLASRPPMSPPQKPSLQQPTASIPPVKPPLETPPQPPAVDQAKLAKPLDPFIDLGKDIASGKNSWV